MKKASADGLVWTPDKLDTWLTNPRAMIPGTYMQFAGIRKAQDRADVIAYLGTSSKPASGN
jgi:cytochrome c